MPKPPTGVAPPPATGVSSHLLLPPAPAPALERGVVEEESHRLLLREVSIISKKDAGKEEERG
jgi:hypothetical protein